MQACEIFEACGRGNLEGVLECLNLGVEVDAQDEVQVATGHFYIKWKFVILFLYIAQTDSLDCGQQERLCSHRPSALGSKRFHPRAGQGTLWGGGGLEFLLLVIHCVSIHRHARMVGQLLPEPAVRVTWKSWMSC